MTFRLKFEDAAILTASVRRFCVYVSATAYVLSPSYFLAEFEKYMVKLVGPQTETLPKRGIPNGVRMNDSHVA